MRRFLLCAAEGILYLFLFYCCSLSVYLITEGVWSGIKSGLVSIICLVSVWLLNITYGKFNPIRRSTQILDFFVFFVISVLFPFAVTRIPPFYDITFIWVPLEWYKFPLNFSLFLKVAPWYAFLFFLFFLFLVYQAAALNKRVLPALLLFLPFGILCRQILTMEAGGRTMGYLVIVLLPALVAFFAALDQKLRVFARASLINWVWFVLFSFYSGIIPVHRFTPVQGIEKIYPRPGEKSVFPLMYMRDLAVDTKQGFLFVSYGPTSGLVRMNLDGSGVRKLTFKERQGGIVRHFYTEPRMEDIFALDWVGNNLLIVPKKSFFFKKQINLDSAFSIVPMDLMVAPGHVYIVSSEFPALSKWNRQNWKRMREVSFRDLKLTSFKSGAWAGSWDPVKHKIFVEIGMVNTKNQFVVAQFDADTLRLEKKINLPEGGLLLYALPSRRRMMLGSFYQPRLIEIDMDSLQVTRTLQGPMTCRGMAYDEKQDLLFAVSFSTGEFHVIRYSTGEKLKSVYVGKKTSSLFWAPETQHVYVGSTEGILRIHIPTFNKINFEF